MFSMKVHVLTEFPEMGEFQRSFRKEQFQGSTHLICNCIFLASEFLVPYIEESPL